MKAVMISIQPKWVEKIANGEKTIEVRKTRPRLETPFKCYIYCLKNTLKHGSHTYINTGVGRKKYGVIGQWRSGKEVVDVNSHMPAYRYEALLAEDKVIGEFVCDRIIEWECKNRLELVGELGLPNVRASYMCFVDDLEKTCLTYEDLWNYGKGNTLYGWHMSNLKIYDEPKELSEFGGRCSFKNEDGSCDNERVLCCFQYWDCNPDCSLNIVKCDKRCARPPKSWSYVEEVEE